MSTLAPRVVRLSHTHCDVPSRSSGCFCLNSHLLPWLGKLVPLCTQTCTNICAHMHSHMYKHARECTNVYIQTCTRMQTHTGTCVHASTHTYTCSHDTSLLSGGPHMGPPLIPRLHQGTAGALRPYLVPSEVPAHSRPVDISSVKEMHVTTFSSLKLSLHLQAGKQACVLFCDPGRATCPWQACCK